MCWWRHHIQFDWLLLKYLPNDSANKRTLMQILHSSRLQPKLGTSRDQYYLASSSSQLSVMIEDIYHSFEKRLNITWGKILLVDCSELLTLILFIVIVWYWYWYEDEVWGQCERKKNVILLLLLLLLLWYTSGLWSIDTSLFELALFFVSIVAQALTIDRYKV